MHVAAYLGELTFPRSTQKARAKDAGLLGYRRCQRAEDAELAEMCLMKWEARTHYPIRITCRNGPEDMAKRTQKQTRHPNWLKKSVMFSP